VAEIHDAVYSYALLAAFGLAGAAGMWELAQVVVPSLGRAVHQGDASATATPRRSRTARWLSAAAVVALLISLVVHARWGHGSSSAEPMAFGVLLGAHPAFLWAAVVLAFTGTPTALLAGAIGKRSRLAGRPARRLRE
jgi:hypothetical protein